MTAFELIMAVKCFSAKTEYQPLTDDQLLIFAALLSAGAVIMSRKQLRKAKRKFFWNAIKNRLRLKRGSGDNKGALKVSLIILGVLLAAMMIYFLSWIGILVIVLFLPLLFIGKKRKRGY